MATPTKPQDERLRIEYVPVDTVRQWERNAKKHDVGALWQSIQRHGFKDPPKFEPTLNGGAGGIVEGNGRSHIIKEMQSAGEEPPRGIIAQENGVWLMPILFGVDAESERAAEAYGVDHNNLVLSGGDFGPSDFTKLWDEKGYAELLADLANNEALPTSVAGEDVDALIGSLIVDGNSNSNGSYDSFEQTQHIVKSDKTKSSMFGVFIECDGEGQQAEMIQRLRDEGYDAVAQGSKPPGCKR